MRVHYSSLLALIFIQGCLAFTPTYHGGQQSSFWSVRSMVKDAPASTGSDISVPYDSAARLAYDEWRSIFSKGDFDPNRFTIFKANYETITVANVSAKKKAREEGIASLTLLSLNEFGDLTEEEYKKALASGSKPLSTGDVLSKAVENAELQSEASSALAEAADALAEEERKLAQTLGLESVDELEDALDSLEGIAPDGGELDSANIAREARVRDSYLKWCKEYGKKPDESRYPTFSNNFLLMEQYAKESKKEMSLNQFADCTKEEYETMQKTKEPKAPTKIFESTAQKVVEAFERDEDEQEARRIAAEKAEKENRKAREIRAKEIADRAKMEAERRKQIDEERATRLKKQSEILAKQQAEQEATVIAAAKADAAAQAKMAAQRAKIEAQAAEKARREAKEWSEKQKKIAQLNAKTTTKKEPSKPAVLASLFSKPSVVDKKKSTIETKKPVVVKSVVKPVVVKPPQTPQSPFSFFGSQPVKQPAPKPPVKPVLPTEVKKNSPSFSFFSPPPPAPSKPSVPIPSPVKEVVKAGPSPFSFFGSPKAAVKKDAKPTPPPIVKPDVKVPNRQGTINIFSSTKQAPKVDVKKAQSSPGTISIFGAKASTPKPDVKVPNRPGTISLMKPPAVSKPSSLFGMFGSSTTKAPSPSLPKPAVTKPAPTFSLMKSPAPAPKIQTPQPSTKSSPSFSFFGSPNAASKSTKVETKKVQTNVPKSPTFSLGGTGGTKTVATKAPPKGVPVLSQWRQNADGSITGKVSNSPNFKPGTQITTSPVPKGAKAGSLVKTGSGSQYFLN